MTIRRGAAWLLLGAAFGLCPAEEPAGGGADLTDLSLEQLMNVEVTTASKKEQNLSDIAGAVYVITQEDIHRSGAETLPDVLRMAPGLIVARVSSSQWAVTARGFNRRFSDKLLVLVDGRSVYSPLFSGVFWDSLGVPLSEIERVEVIRGPGASLWGANAVNGVINIITKSSKETQGTRLTAASGTEEVFRGYARFGGAAGESFHYRVFGRSFDREESALSNGDPAHDGWTGWQGGFRADRDLSSGGRLLFEGDGHDYGIDQRFTLPELTAPFSHTVDNLVDSKGFHLLGRWERQTGGRGQTTLQGYLDSNDRDEVAYGERRDTIDLDFQHRFRVATHHEVIWGLGYRETRDQIRSSFTVTFDPDHREDDLISLFALDEISFSRDRIHLTLGAKYEHNDYTGSELQPDARFIFRASQRHAFWASVSRALRVPNRADANVRVNLQTFPTGLGIPGVASLIGDPDLVSERLTSYEAGYRFRPAAVFSLDLSLFNGVYDDIIGARPGTPFVEATPSPAHLVVPTFFANNTEATTRGGEISASWQVTKSWSLTGWYSYLWLSDHPDDGAEGTDPRAQTQVRSYLDLHHGLSFDAILHFTGELPSIAIDHYLRWDARLAWQATDSVELSLVGQDLLKSRHSEFAGPFLFTETTQLQRSVCGRIAWRF